MDDWRVRFAALIRKHTEVTSQYVDTPCWEWTGWKDSYGYGRFSFPKPGVYQVSGKNARRHAYAHRLSYQIRYGKLEGQLDLDHECNNHWCVRPSHLTPVTHAENIRRRTERDRIAKADRDRPILVEGSSN